MHCTSPAATRPTSLITWRDWSLLRSFVSSAATWRHAIPPRSRDSIVTNATGKRRTGLGHVTFYADHVTRRHRSPLCALKLFYVTWPATSQVTWPATCYCKSRCRLSCNFFLCGWRGTIYLVKVFLPARRKKAAQKPRTRVFIAILPNFRTKGVVKPPP